MRSAPLTPASPRPCRRAWAVCWNLQRRIRRHRFPGSSCCCPVSASGLLKTATIPTATGRRPATLAEMFAAQAAARPNQTALRFDGGHWTYAQLNHRAEALAAALDAAGIGPGRAGWHFHRGAARIWSPRCLPCWPRRAYLPLDPAYPARAPGRDAGGFRRVAGHRGRRGEVPLPDAGPPRLNLQRFTRGPAVGLPHRGCRPGRAGLPALHVRFHRCAQGRPGPARGRRKSLPLDVAGIRAGRGRRFLPAHQPELRGLDLGDLRRAGLWRVARDPAGRRRPGRCPPVDDACNPPASRTWSVCLRSCARCWRRRRSSASDCRRCAAGSPAASRCRRICWRVSAALRRLPGSSIPMEPLRFGM